MSFWPGKGLFSNRNKRLQKVQLVWIPPDKFDVNNGANQIEKPKQTNGSIKEENGRGLSVNSTSALSNGKSSKKVIKKNESGRGKKKKRNCKATNDQSSDSHDKERLNGKHENGGKGKGKLNGHKETHESADNIKSDERRTRSKRIYSKSIKLEESEDSREIEEDKNVDDDAPMKRAESICGDDDDSDDWDGVRDGLGPWTRCSSSSSLSSSCSNSSLIKHYTNVIMNCCDNHFKEECDYVYAKIDCILKAHWQDRLNLFKSKGSPSNTNDNNCGEKTDSQPSKQLSQSPSSSASDSIGFELRPARLPLNKKTWTKLRRSNRNSDWLLNEET